MGRYHSYPTLYEDLKAISIADLKRLGYLISGYRSGNLKWTNRGELTGNVDITVWLSEEEHRGILQFYYIYEKEREYRYQVDLVAVPSNLGIGQRWYFVCPRTGKRCSKLYLLNECFQHRTGAPGVLYLSQTRSKYRRRFDRFFNLHDQQCKPYLKRHYRGVLTKRYLKARIAAKNAERIGKRLLAEL